jgi:hypothetical protein
MKEIPLTRGKFTTVDDEDYDDLMQYKWHCTKAGYAARGKWINGKQVLIYMHRYLLNAAPGTVVDHLDGNKRNNQRSNILLCTQSENMANSIKYNKTGFKGVCRSLDKYAAYIDKHKKRMYLGTFNTAEEAAKAYDKKAIEIHGVHALTNFQ